MNGSASSRAVVITGAARSVGLEAARRAHAAGFTVFGLDLNQPEDATPFEHFLQGDLRDADFVEAVVARASEATGSIYGLVNNAAHMRVGPFLDATLDDLQASFAVNLTAAFLLTQAAVRSMVSKSTEGVVVNLTSVNADRGVVGTAVYSATKGALASLTRTLAVELSVHGIRCNAVAPSLIATYNAEHLLTPAQVESRKSRVPLGRLAAVAEVADAIVFLLSDQSKFMTGITLPVDGGYLAYGNR